MWVWQVGVACPGCYMPVSVIFLSLPSPPSLSLPPLSLPPPPSDKVQEETDHFLQHKSEWKDEIEQKLEELKQMESVLSSREQEIQKVCI